MEAGSLEQATPAAEPTKKRRDELTKYGVRATTLVGQRRPGEDVGRDTGAEEHREDDRGHPHGGGGDP